MPEWWTYRPSDFLMFAPSTYWRLFELHNAALWPAPWLLVIAGTLWLAWRAWQGQGALRSGIAALALAWAFVGVAFLWQRFEPIQWAAAGFAVGFVMQAGVLVVLAGQRELTAAPVASLRDRAGLALVAAALWFHPLLAPAAGRPWGQAEVFALAPDPTAIATLGLLLSTQATAPSARRWLRAAWVLPLAWCAVSAATLLTMDSAQGAVPLGAALLALAAARRGGGLPPTGGEESFKKR